MAQAEGDFGYFVGGDGGGDAFVVVDWEDRGVLDERGQGRRIKAYGDESQQRYGNDCHGPKSRAS